MATLSSLTYSPLLLGYYVGASENNIKCSLIHDINTIQCILSKKPIDSKQFDDLIDSSLEYLISIVMDQSSLLSTHL